jgi:hypothetical protein
MGESDRAQGLDETSAPSGAIGERALHLRSDDTVSLRARSAFEWVGALRARAKSVCCSSGGALPARSIAAHADGFTNGCDAVVTAALLPERRTSQQERERCERREHARRACERARSALVCSRPLALRSAVESLRSFSPSDFASRARSQRQRNANRTPLLRPRHDALAHRRLSSSAALRRDEHEHLVQHDQRARGRCSSGVRVRERTSSSTVARTRIDGASSKRERDNRATDGRRSERRADRRPTSSGAPVRCTANVRRENRASSGAGPSSSAVHGQGVGGTVFNRSRTETDARA